MQDEVTDPSNPPSGCFFHPRCQYTTEKCKVDEPRLRTVNGHEVACHYAEELELLGVVTA